jgi:hypothetical protein
MLVLRLIVFHISCEVKRGIDEVDPRALPEKYVGFRAYQELLKLSEALKVIR